MTSPNRITGAPQERQQEAKEVHTKASLSRTTGKTKEDGRKARKNSSQDREILSLNRKKDQDQQEDLLISNRDQVSSNPEHQKILVILNQDPEMTSAPATPSHGRKRQATGLSKNLKTGHSEVQKTDLLENRTISLSGNLTIKRVMVKKDHMKAVSL